MAQWLRIRLQMQEMEIWSLGREAPLREGNGDLLQYSCLGNHTDKGCLLGCGPWSRKKLDMTEHTDPHGTKVVQILSGTVPIPNNH